MINTNLNPILHGIQVMADMIIGHIFASERGVPKFNALLGGSPANIAINDISLKHNSLDNRRKYRCSDPRKLTSLVK